MQGEPRTVMIVEHDGSILLQRYERTYSDNGTPWDHCVGQSCAQDWPTLLRKRKPWVQPGPVKIVARWRAGTP